MLFKLLSIKINILVLISFLYLLTTITTAIAQDKIDSLTTNLNKLSLSNSPDSVRLELGYRLKNTKNIEYLIIKLGTSNGGAEIFESRLQVVEHHHQKYIKYDDTIMPIQGNKSAFLKMIPKKYLLDSNYITIIGKEFNKPESVFYTSKLR